MSIVNSLLKPRLILPFCVALAVAGHPFPTSGVSWFDKLGMTSAQADDDDDDDRYGDDDDRYQDDRYGDDDDDRYDDDNDDDDD
jgi:hypothetical protein